MAYVGDVMFHRKIDRLRQDLLTMGLLVDEQLRRATHALLECEHGMAKHAIALDSDVDELELRVDETCIQLIGLHQPAAADLRFIVAASLEALRRGDAAGARAVMAGDAALDELEREIVRGLLRHAMRDASRLRAVYPLANASRRLERVGDHAANIAEMALYSAEGVVERHWLSVPCGAGEPRPPRPAAQAG